MPTSSSEPSHADNAGSRRADSESVMATIRAQQARGRGARRALAAGLVLLVAAIIGWMVWPESAPTRWRTETVGRGDMQLTATATGSLEPKSEVSVGAEISGLVQQVLVDENDPVSIGQVLARFDTDELEVALEQAEAQLAVAEASVDEAAATVDEAAADERRQTLLRQRGTAAQADLDAAVAARKRAQAQLALSRASVRQARATVSQARTRLEKAVITSPINGVVLKRAIGPGTTVAASFQTPELFLLAEDLSAMELHVSMDEADVGLVHPDQSASFTVDAWPGRAFPAKVLKVHLYPTVENNVVTYNTVLSVDNTDGLLSSPEPPMASTRR
ncbi:efflux RND transporter periplasmic adaptor subunit [Marinobacter sp. C2H3]|uniref:efflux RND transporter periplasmic adaptor subunit n=1 Tax=Marinobacter sp. C2H3 TaxID=3119003 RepID=UPI00300E7D9D